MKSTRPDPVPQTDVAIIGGGLAGLTLALQLKKTNPDLQVAVFERQPHPRPTATAKVGESTVEIGAHYLGEVVGLRQHLNDAQLPKYGLRLFFGDTDGDFSGVDELGPSKVLSVPTYQIDRGVLENHIAREVAHLGVRFYDDTRVTGIQLDLSRAKSDGHMVSINNGQQKVNIHATWLVDTAGRSSLLKHKLKLEQDNQHDCDAVWFRVPKKIYIDEWSTCQNWHARAGGEHKRWLSTNHLMGAGYWVWIIPLACGATSIGIVFDPTLHNEKNFRSYTEALAWLKQHQPRIAPELSDCEPLDFRLLRNYSHDCKQVFSAQRWALSGEAGVFLDPFYSPGTDFIGISNTFIVDLIARDLAGESIRRRSLLFQQLYDSFFQNTLSLYQHQYPGFGDRHLMMLKTIWDYAFYWGILSLLFFNKVLTDIEFMGRINGDLISTQKYNQHIQMCFRERASKAKRLKTRGLFVDQAKVPCLRKYNHELTESLDKEALAKRIHENSAELENLAMFIEDLLVQGATGVPCKDEATLLGDLRQRLAA